MRDKTFSSTDLALVSFLRCKGFQIKGLKRVGETKVAFILVDKPERPQLVLDFYNGTATLPALEYFNAIQDTKSLIFNLDQ